MISIIDDDRSVREAVKSLIRSLGYEAVTFASAEEYLGADAAYDSECVITASTRKPTDCSKLVSACRTDASSR